MSVREKLIEILKQAPFEGKVLDEWWWEEKIKMIADHLIANGVTVQKWISVKDRLPEEDGKYLVFEQNNGRTNTSILRFAKDARKVDRYDFKSRWENAWYEYDSEWGHYTVDSVTHWMPLPEMPQK